MTSTLTRSDRAPARITPALLVVLALLSAVAPFATDLYLPAFTAMTDDLGTDATGVQLTLTAFLVGVAVGQLVIGPISDRIGRRVPLVVGAIVLVVASVLTIVAPSIELLVAARLVQGLAGAAGMVIGRAVVADLAAGAAAAKAMSLMMIVGGVAPVVAPLVGGLIATPIGWRGIMAVVAGIAVVMLLAVLGVRETHPAEHRGGTRLDLRALASARFLGAAIAFAFAFAVMMAYISASPFVYQSMLGLDELQYAAMFGVNALALVVVSGLSARLVGRIAPSRLAAVGIGLSLAGSLAVLAIAVTGAPAWLLAIALLVAVASLGLVLGNATALALAAVPAAAGTGSAVLGALQFGLAAAVSPLVSIAGEATAVPLGIVMLVVALIAAAGLAIGMSQRATR